MSSDHGVPIPLPDAEKALLRYYAGISRVRPGAAAATALRTRSRSYADVLAFQASRGSLDWDRLKVVLCDSVALKRHRLDPLLLGEVGRVVLLHPTEPGDACAAAAALRCAIDALPANSKSRVFRRLLLDHLIVTGHREDAKELLDLWPDVDREHSHYRRAELLNPWLFEGGCERAWLDMFNEPITAAGLMPVRLRGDAPLPFDRIATGDGARGSDLIPGTPLVSVIMTVYNPDPRALETSIGSILAQTLTEFELIIVDDSSDDEFGDAIALWESKDPRVRVVRLPENGGTYKARNVGFSFARGVFVTGQDADDWSHPERLRHQVDVMRADTKLAGCVVKGIACTENLGRVRVGRAPDSGNASSLMLRRKDFAQLGGFMEVRKGADTELSLRLRKLTKASVDTIDKPLSIIRNTGDSLSGSDFAPGWRHASRHAFRDSYEGWHGRASDSALKVTGRVEGVHVPRRFRVAAETREKLDVVFVADWRSWNGSHDAALDEIRVLQESGLRVGVMQLEDPQNMARKRTAPDRRIQRLIDGGEVDQLLYDDHAEVELLIVVAPGVLQFPPDSPSGLHIGRVAIVAGETTTDADGCLPSYLPPDCSANALSMFGADVLWVPRDARVRNALAALLSSAELASFDLPGVINPQRWRESHESRRSRIPVIGHHLDGHGSVWPSTARLLREAYATDGSVDVRFLARVSPEWGLCGGGMSPAAWTLLTEADIAPKQFLRALDHWILQAAMGLPPGAHRRIIEALAAGLVVVLPPEYETAFGSAAIYARPHETAKVIHAMQGDSVAYAAQVTRAALFLESRFSDDAYTLAINELRDEVRVGAS